MPSLTKQVKKPRGFFGKAKDTKKDPIRRWLTVDDSNLNVPPKKPLVRN